MTTANKEKALIPIFHIFTYWIFAWAVLYISGVLFLGLNLKTKIPPMLHRAMQWLNPALVLVIATIWNTLSLIKFFVTGKSWWIIFKYALMIVVIKAVPLWFIWKLYLRTDMNALRDVAIFLSVFAIYNVYLWINGTDFVTVYDDLTVSEENDENRTPFEHALTQFLTSTSTS